MVRYYGRAKQRIGSVNTNQVGLKMSGCASTIGKSGSLLTYQTNRSKCNIKFCGDVRQHGLVVKTNNGKNCVERAPRGQSFNSGVGHINAPRFSCNSNCSTDGAANENCKITSLNHPYLSDIEHGAWVYNSFFEIPEYLNAAYVWVGDVELDASKNPTVKIWAPGTPATNNEDYYVNIFNKKLSLIIDARINGNATEEDYRPCLITTDPSKCLPPIADEYVSYQNNTPCPNESIEYIGHSTDKSLPHNPIQSSSSGCLLWGMKNYKSGISIDEFKSYSPTDMKNMANLLMGSESILDSHIMSEKIKDASGSTCVLNVLILKRLMDQNHVSCIQLDIEPYNFETKTNLNIFISKLCDLLKKNRPNIQLNAFLFPYYIRSSEFPSIDNFVPIFSCYDLWGPEFGDTTSNQIGIIINTLAMYRYKIKILFNHIKSYWNNKKYKLGILGAASVHEYEKYVPPKDSQTCALKIGFPIYKYLQVFFDELKIFWNANPSIKNNFRGFSVWGWLNAVSYPDPKDKSYRRYYRQNSFLPFQPKYKALEIIECNMKSLGVFKSI